MVEDGVVSAIIDGETVRFGWQGAMTVNGRAVSWEEYPHYDSAYTQTPWGAETMTLAHGGKSLTLALKG